jgi:hypothetical protein
LTPFLRPLAEIYEEFEWGYWAASSKADSNRETALKDKKAGLNQSQLFPRNYAKFRRLTGVADETLRPVQLDLLNLVSRQID